VSNRFDVIVLGGGPAGYVCAIRAAQLGLSTAVIEKDKLGGVCVNIGCIPTKALLHSALVANTIAHDAKGLGIAVEGVSTDYGVAMKRSRRVSEQNSKGVGFLMKKHKVTVISGTGTLLPGKQVAVEDQVYTADKGIVIATGSRVKGIPPAGLNLDGKVIISSDEALFLEHAPASIAVVGAGAVGCEFADIFNAFGSAVTLIEALPRILPLEDAAASDVVAKSFKKRKIKSIAGAMVKNTEVREGGATLTIEAAGKTETVDVDVVLVAAGRAVNTEGIGLEAIGAELDDRGFIRVNLDTLETTAQGYYAIGDVAGPPMLAHKGSREGVVVAERLAGHTPHPIRYDNIPSVTYCHPEVASIGLTEEACAEQGLEYQAGLFPFSANGRARASNATDGFVKILRDTKYGEILGAHIVGADASEMIHELAVARENEFTVEEIDLAVHAHPTLSEAIAEAALDSLGRVMHT
jgi:dihydrolipoamide dehydrogenase